MPAQASPTSSATNWTAVLDLVSNEITRPRLLRVAAHHAGYLLISTVMWSLPFTRLGSVSIVSGVGRWILLVVVQWVALGVHVFGCGALERLRGVEPPSAFPALPPGIFRLLLRISFRNGNMEDVAKVLMLYIGFAAVGALNLALLLGSGSMGSGVALGVFYCAWWLASGQEDIHFPAVHRRWLFQLKHCLPHSAQVAVILSSLLLVWHLLMDKHLITSDLLLWSMFCVWSWCGMNVLLHSILSERHIFSLTERASESDASSSALLRTLMKPSNMILKGLAYQDLCQLSEEQGIVSSRRKLIFGSEQGSDIWNAIRTACLRQIWTTMVQLIECLPEKTGAKGTARNSPSQESTPNVRLRAAIGIVRESYHEICSSIRALGGLVVASFAEDQYGHVQLGSPGLPDIVMAFIDFLVLVNRLMEHQVSLSPAEGRRKWLWSRLDAVECVDCGFDGLLDTLRTTLYAIVYQFDGRLRESVKAAAPKLLYLKSQKDALALLDKMLKGEA